MSANVQEAKKRLAQILFEKSYMEGDFTLTSGRKSDYYFDCRQSSLHAEGAFLIGNLLYSMITDDSIVAVGGMTMGADPLITATSLAAYAQGRQLPGLIVRKEVKGHGTARAVEGLANVNKGDHVLVVEDVLSTGGSALRACARLEEAGLVVRSVLCILNREEGGAEAVQAAGYTVGAIFTRSELVALGRV